MWQKKDRSLAAGGLVKYDFTTWNIYILDFAKNPRQSQEWIRHKTTLGKGKLHRKNVYWKVGYLTYFLDKRGIIGVGTPHILC